MELEFLEIEFHAKKKLVFKEPYSDVLKSYSGVFLQKIFIITQTGFNEPYSGVLKPYSDILKPYSGVFL